MMSVGLTAELLQISLCDPTRPFCVHYARGDATIITWGDLHERSARVAGALTALGCAVGDVVVMFPEHQPDTYAIFIGCLLHGATPAIMPHPSAKQDSQRYWASHKALLERLSPRLIVVSAALAPKFHTNLPEFSDRICEAEVLPTAPRTDERPAIATDIAFLQFSSGTTSGKKGVLLSHDQVLAQVVAYRSAIRFTKQDVIASWLPLYHDMGLITCFMLPLVTGATLVALDPFEWVAEPALLFEVIARHRATISWMPNFAFNHLVNTTRRDFIPDLSSLRAIINCSEPCRVDSFQRFYARFAEFGLKPDVLQICYAMAESVFAVTQTPLGTSPRTLEICRARFEAQGRAVPGAGLRLLSCGPPLDSVQLRIVDNQGVDLPDGATGEIVIAAPFLFSGYVGQPDVTGRVLRNGGYYSGDLGFLDNGELFVTGRRDDLLLSYGKNYYAHEIEAVASTVTGVVPGRCAAFAVLNEAAGTNQIVLVVETDRLGDKTLERNVRAAVSDATGLILHHIELQKPGWLIKTTSGKVSRRANHDRFLALKSTQSSVVACSDTWRTLVTAVAEIFQVDPHALNAQTLAIDVPGWDSVSEVMLLIRLEDDFRVKLEFAELHKAADLSALAALIESRLPRMKTVALGDDKTRRPILVYGNCQAGVYADMLKSFVAPQQKVLYLMSFDHPTEAAIQASAADFGSCALVLQQIDQAAPLPEWITRQLPADCMTIRFPPLDFNLLWPFNMPDPRNVSEPPEFPFGRFPYGDRIVVELLREGYSGEELWKIYQARSIEKLPDLARLETIESQRLMARDIKCDVQIAPIVMSEYKNRKLFWTINHPTGWLMGQLFSAILSSCDNVLPSSDDCKATAGQIFAQFEPFGHHAQPIHPEVVSRLGLKWVVPHEKYRYLDGSIMNFEETMKRYIRFQ